MTSQQPIVAIPFLLPSDFRYEDILGHFLVVVMVVVMTLVVSLFLMELTALVYANSGILTISPVCQSTQR